MDYVMRDLQRTKARGEAFTVEGVRREVLGESFIQMEVTGDRLVSRNR